MPNNQGHQTQAELEEQQGVAGTAVAENRGVATSENQPADEGAEATPPAAEETATATDSEAVATPTDDATTPPADAEVEE